MNSAIVPGSMQAIATQSGKSLAESFMQCDAVVIVDTSGSMDTHDSRGGLTRYEVACSELKNLQSNLPGKIAVISFSSDVEFCPAGIPTHMGGGTNLSKALRFVKVADVTDMKFILISDGDPDDPAECIQLASGFKNRIDVIYVGPEDRPSGRNFLDQLAKVTGGKSVTADRAKELGSGVMKLLAG